MYIIRGEALILAPAKFHLFLIASRTVLGVSGSRLMRVPVALNIAFALREQWGHTGFANSPNLLFALHDVDLDVRGLTHPQKIVVIKIG